MADFAAKNITTAEIRADRPAKNAVDADRPYAFLVEHERTAAGTVEPVATLFLTGSECPFHCLMCDLWKNTLDRPTPPGALPRQIDYALDRLPHARHIKLYNSGNFFDPRAVPPEDHAAIAERLRGFETVIVENHPRLCGPECLQFAGRLDGQLEIALGLETVHRPSLEHLNKQMSVEDFAAAAAMLVRDDIALRAFILLQPPFLSEGDGLYWTDQSVRFAFDQGVGCCAIIPTRTGNGIMDRLHARGEIGLPSVESLEASLASGIELHRGRVFVDLWDFQRFATCSECREARHARLDRMNREQCLLPPVVCPGCSGEPGPASSNGTPHEQRP